MDDPTTPGLQILILEDNDTLRRALTRVLTHNGHDVKPTKLVAQALLQPGPFDLAVLDLQLPDGSGIDAARRLLREDRAGRVFFFTGSSDDQLLAYATVVAPVYRKDELYRLLAAIAAFQPGSSSS